MQLDPVERIPSVGGVDRTRIAAVEPGLVDKLSSQADAILAARIGEDPPIICDLRRNREADPTRTRPDVLLWLEPQVAHRFWLGQEHEPCLLAAGSLRVEGPLATIVTMLGSLEAISAAYRRALGVSGGDPLRFSILKAFPTDGLEQTLPGLPARLSGSSGDQSLLAALIVLGLPGGCRQLEIPPLVAAFRSGEIDPAGFGRVLQVFRAAAENSAVAPQSEGEPTSDETDGIVELCASLDDPRDAEAVVEQLADLGAAACALRRTCAELAGRLPAVGAPVQITSGGAELTRGA